jgi:hypothetical protein
MTRPFARRLAIALVLLAWSSACAGGDELSVTEAEAGLRSSPTFTTREGSVIGRELVEVVAIRRIGSSSTEVEFTWRDAVPATRDHADRANALHTSMALFRLRSDGVWSLNSLYKVN